MDKTPITNTTLVPQVALWLFVLSASILTGGGIFEHLVLTPLWAGSPPESVTQWQYGSIQRNFFIVVTPAYFFFSLLLLIASRWMPPRQRRLAMVAAIAGIVVCVWTFLFFIPILQKTQATRGAGLSGEEITRLVTQFKNWNWVRWIIIIVGWLAGLRAFSLSSSESSS